MKQESAAERNAKHHMITFGEDGRWDTDDHVHRDHETGLAVHSVSYRKQMTLL